MAKTKNSGSRGSSSGFPPWSKACLAPVVLLLGKQRVFADRAVAQLRRQAVQEASGEAEIPEVTEVDVTGYVQGMLRQYVSPSLFGGRPVVIVRGVEDGNAQLQDDLLAYVSAVGQGGAGNDAYLILSHSGGVKGKKLLSLCKSGAASVFTCDELKYDNQKEQFLISEARGKGRVLEADAAAALVAGLGSNFEELLAVTDQLLDTEGDLAGALTLQQVQVYLRGRVEATGFNVADAAVSGQVSQALSQLRHALAIGVAPVLIVTAVGVKLRQMLMLSAPAPAEVVRSGWLGEVKPPGGFIAREAFRVLSKWDDARLGQAVAAVAAADEQVKGGARDVEYALEAMVLQICRLASGHAVTVGKAPR